MNHKNTLFVVMDSVRYDQFLEAETPHLDSLGETRKVYSPSCWTIPSMISYFIIPSPIGKVRILPNRMPEWAPTFFKKKGYHTSLLTENLWVKLYQRFFADFDAFLYFDFNRASTDKMIECATKIVVNQPRFFIVLHTMITHYPYKAENQIEKIELLDQKIGRFLTSIPKNTWIIITSDHGECLGERGDLHHNPAQIRNFHRELFEIPLIVKEF